MYMILDYIIAVTGDFVLSLLSYIFYYFIMFFFNDNESAIAVALRR